MTETRRLKNIAVFIQTIYCQYIGIVITILNNQHLSLWYIETDF